ncbi:hypothetical protein QC763_409470 [Podospora pseudopauciseta]|uniref:Uncharacterized protein n=1 Tax=Podospora pseudopauciseta TaxID=2093780 RepID=A0ABR0HCK7_9PEZI|nr:hypothetical protein QC763_409470 [Podospora pseudopauciseta]
MDDLSRMSDVESDFAVMDATPSTNRRRPGMVGAAATTESREGPSAFRSPLSKSRSLSDGGGAPKLSPSPCIVEASRRQSQDDIAIRDKDTDIAALRLPPSTPIRAGFPTRGLSLQMAPTEPSSPAPQPQAAGYVKQAPLSPKLDHSHIYASPTNILPRRSRGLDFSRAATSLHHSTLANQADPDSSPTIGSRAMNIPNRRSGDHAGADHAASSHWGTMGHHHQERMQISSSLGSTSHVLSESSSDSDEDDYMDEDMEEAYIMTPQASRTGMGHMAGGPSAPGWMPGSPAVSNFLSFQQRQRQRKQSTKKKMRGPLGLGFHSPAASGAISKSPPNNLINSRDLPHTRRESISWAANQLHISGNESDGQLEGLDSPSRPSIVRRAVTRRGNLLPKTKGFARIRAALAEEGAPIETEFRREAEVVRQVRESDMDLEPRLPPAPSAATTALSSPNLDSQVHPDEMMPDDAMMIEGSVASHNPTNNALGLSPATFKQQVLKNSKGKVFWDTFSESSSNGGAGPRTTTPPPPSFVTRASSSGVSLDDVNMDSPSSNSQSQNPFVLPLTTGTSSSGNGTPHQPPGGSMPSAAEITRRINSKRRRGDDDFNDPISIKRRAVSPGMSAHGSPVLQSPLQRGGEQGWGALSLGPAITTTVGQQGQGQGQGGGGSRPGSSVGGGGEGGNNGMAGSNNKRGRVGLQGMVDTNDGITRLSIE